MTGRLVVVPGSGLDAGNCVRWGADASLEVEVREGDPADVLGSLPAEDPPRIAGVIIAPGPEGLDAGALAAAVASTSLPVVAVVPDNLRKTVAQLEASRLVVAGARLLYGRGAETARHAVLYLARRRRHTPDTLAYGPEPGQEGDLWVPPGAGPHPVAVLFHGGFWYHAWERDLMDGLALDLSRRGIAAWNVGYRRVGAGGGWPATGDDANRGTEHLLALAPVYGLDLDRVAVLGHSAGAQLALWVAARRRRAAVRPIVAVGLATIADLAAARAEGTGGGSVGRFLAGAGDPEIALAEASPMARLPIGVAQILAHAVDDGVVPVTQTTRYAEAARAAGDEVEVLELEQGGHFDLVDPATPAWEAVVSALEARLR
ncbi:MAG TPA: alpha/beta hydrolase [Acidimicrobiia bacterium]|nr:alpha/beta hydrolase [Acidimicrobiia bacterium]